MGICDSSTKQKKNREQNSQTKKNEEIEDDIKNTHTSPCNSDSTGITQTPLYLSDQTRHENIHSFYTENSYYTLDIMN